MCIFVNAARCGVVVVVIRGRRSTGRSVGRWSMRRTAVLVATTSIDNILDITLYNTAELYIYREREIYI